MVSNWKTQEMSFVVNGEQHTIRGDPSLGRSQITLKAMLKTLRKEGGGLWLEFNLLEEENAVTQETQEVPAFLKGVMGEFVEVFDSPKGLPPPRGHEHAIILKDGSDPVSVRPYRYPQF